MNDNVGNYLIALQKEYLMAEMRHIIYPLNIDKVYYAGQMEAKKNNVLRITEEHIEMFPENIFNSPSLMSKMRYEFANAYSYPNFTYLTERNKKFEASDLTFYYKIDSPVCYYSESKFSFESGFVAKPTLSRICKVCYYSAFFRKLEIGYFLDTDNSKIIVYNMERDIVDTIWRGYVFDQSFIFGKVWVKNKNNPNLHELVDKSLVVRQDIVW